MKFPPIRYLRPSALPQALDDLKQHDGSIKVLAGGQSLFPLMAMRLTEPEVILDINALDELKEIRDMGDCLAIGALIRHQQLIEDVTIQQQAPVLSLVARHIGHLAIRCRGTIGGSLVHSDPSAELPLAICALDGELIVQSADETKVVPAEEFFLSYLTSAVAANEMLTTIRVPKMANQTKIAFDEVASRAGDFALVSVLAIVTFRDDGAIQSARLAIGGVSDVPFRARDAELLMNDAALTPELVTRVARTVSEAIEPVGDLHASADFRRHLARVLTERVLKKVIAGAKGDLSWNPSVW
ncbi:MAG: FAD binding domain-containing protein [Sulfobacillus sp.]